VGVERHAVALVARLRHLARAALLVPAPARVAGHVAEEEVPARRVPDRPLRECESGPDLLDFGRRVDQVVELLRVGLDTHTRLLSLITECVPNLPRVPPSKPAPPTPSSFTSTRLGDDEVDGRSHRVGQDRVRATVSTRAQPARRA